MSSIISATSISMGIISFRFQSIGLSLLLTEILHTDQQAADKDFVLFLSWPLYKRTGKYLKIEVGIVFSFFIKFVFEYLKDEFIKKSVTFIIGRCGH